MLTISPINNMDYYTDLAKDDYYTGGGEPIGQWHGIGARCIGLPNEVNKSDFHKIMQGFDLHDAPLVQNAGSKTRRHGWDCTFSAPKSVSLLWARAGTELRTAIQNAQQKAVNSSIAFLEKYAAITRRDAAGLTIENVSGLVVATFEHCTSRAQDFQLHTHALICNVAPRFDDTWGSIESRKLYYWQKAAGAIYRSELAAQLHALGFHSEIQGDSFHLKGIDKELCAYFSKRSIAIEKELEQSGLSSSASQAGDNIKLMTREHKSTVDRAQLLKKWQQELDTLDCPKTLAEDIKQNPNQFLHQESYPELILKDITDKAAIFHPQDVFYELAIKSVETGTDSRTITQQAQELLNDDQIVKLDQQGHLNINLTTRDVLAQESLMINTAKHLASQVHFALDGHNIQQTISESEIQLGFNFDDEQQEAIYSALTGGDLAIVQGSAGAGKTTLMLAARKAYEKAGYSIKGACIAKRAADNLEEESGIKSVTVASLITAIDDGKSPLKNIDILVVDEAGQLGSTDLLQLLCAAKDSRCKIILTGEDKQLDAIQRGGSLRLLSRPEFIGTQRIENIRRQRMDWSRQMVANFRDGNSQQALKALQEHSGLHWASNSANAKEQLIRDLHSYQKNNPEKSSLVLAQRWQDVKELSDIIRSIHIAEGRVGNESISVKCSIADKQFEYQFSRGDRVKFCKNDYKDLKVSNGTLGTISDIRILQDDAHFTIDTDDNRKVTFLASDYADDKGTNLCLAYALTIYSSQGVTVDGNTFVYYNSSMGRANTYVAASRHKDEVHLYCNTKEVDEYLGITAEDTSIAEANRLAALADLMAKDNYSTLAIEHLPKKELSAAHSQRPEIVHEMM